MTLIYSLKSSLGLSRVEFSKSFPKTQKQMFSKMSNLEKFASEKDVFVKLSPSEKNGNAIIQVLRKGIDHVADIPEYAVKNNTGDQVYVNWTKILGAKEVPSNEFALTSAAKQFVKEA